MLLSGAPPFTLVAGSATVGNGYLPIGNLVPDGRLDCVPLMDAHTFDGALATLVLASSDDGMGRGTILLWLALALGTATLGGIVWALYRTMRRQQDADLSPPVG